MYISDGQISGFEAGREPVILRPSERFHYQPAPPFVATQLASFPSFYGLGEPTPPKGLKLFDHFQVPKTPDPANAGQFVSGSVTKLSVADLNPGFIDASDNLILDTSSDGLHTCLKKLITSKFQSYLSSSSNTSPTAGDRLRVALVDLTGNKITKPDFAGWGTTVPMYGASVPKMLAVYAAHQLRKDLQELATTQSISDGRILEKEALKLWKLGSNAPQLVWLFDIRKWSGSPSNIDFSTDAKKALAGIMHNHEAGQLIVGVGFPYIASVTFQSGLFHPTRGGLWLTTSYGKGKSGTNPVKAKYSANVTALSVATFFTLLAQQRMVDTAGSSGIESSLRGGCVTGAFPTTGVVASKCGIWSDYLHDCALIHRANARYVVIGLTRTKKADLGKYAQLFTELDDLIVRNNQSPKPGC